MNKPVPVITIYPSFPEIRSHPSRRIRECQLRQPLERDEDLAIEIRLDK